MLVLIRLPTFIQSLASSLLPLYSSPYASPHIFSPQTFLPSNFAFPFTPPYPSASLVRSFFFSFSLFICMSYSVFTPSRPFLFHLEAPASLMLSLLFIIFSLVSMFLVFSFVFINFYLYSLFFFHL